MITGFELEKFREMLNSETPITPDKEVLPGHLLLLCERAHKQMKLASYILVSEGDCFYRGVIMEDVLVNRWGNYGSYTERYLTVAYKGADGKRAIIKMQPYGSSGCFYCFENQSIRAYPIDFSESLFIIKEQPIIDEYDVFEQYDVVSIGHNANGFFFINRNNNRISVYFDSIHRDPAGCFVIEKDSFFGIANNFGQVILNPRFCAINPFSEGLAAIRSYDMWGFVSYDGNIVIDPQFESAEDFNNGISKVSVSDHVGFINKDGNGVFIKDSCTIEFPEYCFITKDGDSIWGCLHGEKNLLKRFSIPALNAKISITQKTCDYTFIGDCLVAKIDGRKYLYSYSGDVSNEIDDCQLLGYCNKFNVKSQQFDGPIVPHIIINDLPFYYIVSRGNNKGVINNSGDIIVPIEYEYIGLLSSQVILAYNGVGMRLFSTTPLANSPKCEVSHTQSFELIEKKEEAWDSKEELNQFYVYNKNKVGFVLYKDGLFETVFPCVYDKIDYDVRSFIIDGIRTDYRILGEYGNYVDKPKDISWMTDFCYTGIAVALKGALFGLIDSGYNILRDYSYNTIFKLDAFHFLLSQNDHIELVRYNRAREESVIMEFPGVVVSRLSPYVFRILRAGKYFVFKYDKEKEELFELLNHGYDNVFGIDESFIVVEIDGFSGCYDNDGHELLEIKYESIVPFKDKKNGYHQQNKSAFDLTENKIIIGYYPLSASDEFICDLYNAESKNLLHIPTSWFYDETDKHNQSKGKGIVRHNWWLDVKYVDEHKPHLGAYIVLNNYSKQSYITPLSCKHFEGPFDRIEPFYDSSGNRWSCSYKGLLTSHNGKYGLIRLNPFGVIPCTFDCPVYYVSRSNRFWILEKNDGKGSITAVYDSNTRCELDLGNVVSIDPVSDSIFMIVVLNEDNEKKCGLVDSTFKQILPFSFDFITSHVQGQYIVYKKDQGYGIVDESGVFIYPLSSCRIDYKWLLEENKGCYLFYDDNNALCAISEDGYLIKDVFDDIEKEFIPNSKNHYFSDKEGGGMFSVCTCFGEKYTGIEDTFTEDDITILKAKDGYFAINTEKRITSSLHEIITINKRLGYLSVKDGCHRQFLDFKGEFLGHLQISVSDMM